MGVTYDVRVILRTSTGWLFDETCSSLYLVFDKGLSLSGLLSALVGCMVQSIQLLFGTGVF